MLQAVGSSPEILLPLHFTQITLNCRPFKIIIMTIKLYSAVSLIIVSTLISCASGDSKDYIDKSLITPESEKKATTQTQAAEAGVLPNTPVIPGVSNINPGIQTNSVNLSQSNNVQVVPTAATTGNLNPAHGQPGHRCDIAVGAPLDSKPAAATAQPATAVNAQPASPVTITQQPAKTVTAPGMNPAHGEPGHRCDIAVGAPLNSKPAPATTAAQPATAITATQPVAQKVAPGMNPAHGEPGHRCDIAVGAPLDSKPPAAPAAVATQAPPPLLTPAKTDSSKN